MTYANIKKPVKKYIYTMYIYRNRDKKCKKGEVCYGYPMGMLWVSYGKGR